MPTPSKPMEIELGQLKTSPLKSFPPRETLGLLQQLTKCEKTILDSLIADLNKGDDTGKKKVMDYILSAPLARLFTLTANNEIIKNLCLQPTLQPIWQKKLKMVQKKIDTIDYSKSTDPRHNPFEILLGACLFYAWKIHYQEMGKDNLESRKLLYAAEQRGIINPYAVSESSKPSCTIL